MIAWNMNQTVHQMLDHFTQLALGDIYILPPNLYYKRILLGNKLVDHSDVVGASPVGAAPTTSSFST